MHTIEPHDWHTFDAERDLDVRQVTEPGQPNRWQVRDADGEIAEYDDAEFDQLRGGDDG